MRKPIDRALQYRRVLKSNPIPIQRPEFGNPKTGKLPLIRTKLLDLGLMSEDEVVEKFQGRDCNVAIQVGRPSALVSFDCDSQRAIEWANANLPETPLRFETGRFEQRLYKRPEVDLPSMLGRHGGDLKMTGHVVLPDSKHYLGKDYRWVDEPTDKLFGEAPIWPGDVQIEERKYQRKTVGQRNDAIYERINKCRRYIGHIMSIEGQGGDRELLRAASACTQVFQLTRDAAIALLIHWNETNAKPPWSPDRIEYKVDQSIELMQRGNH